MNVDETRLLAQEAECLGMVESALFLVRQAHGKWRTGVVQWAALRSLPVYDSEREGQLREVIGLLQKIETGLTDEVSAATRF